MSIIDYLEKVRNKQKAVKEENYEKIMSTEVYECNNPALMNAFKNEEFFELLIANAAEAVGKILQSEMAKQKDTSKISAKMVSKAMKQVYEYDVKRMDAVSRAPQGCIKVLLGTWKHSEALAGAMGIDKKQYDEIREDLKRNYLAKQTSENIKPRERED